MCSLDLYPRWREARAREARAHGYAHTLREREKERERDREKKRKKAKERERCVCVCVCVCVCERERERERGVRERPAPALARGARAGGQSPRVRPCPNKTFVKHPVWCVQDAALDRGFVCVCEIYLTEGADGDNWTRGGARRARERPERTGTLRGVMCV